MKKRYVIIAALLLALSVSLADDGMWLPHQMKMLNLKEAGLEMDPGMLYKEDGTGIMSAIVHLGGGTGEFVSQDGLILTNHHVAFGAIQRASDKEHDYITDGFIAWEKTQEIQAQGYVANVLLGYEDVTEKVLHKVKSGMKEEKRSDIINENIAALREEAETRGSDIQVRIAAMYQGNQYFMFIFKHIEDVRLVYAPPRDLGNYGGDIDNWMWPRHTCDFTFLRAYVSPDGAGVPYSQDNVPYQPKSVLKISLDGLEEGDFTFVMGYPGRTFRNYMLKEVEGEVDRMRTSIEQRESTINFLEKAGEKDRGVQIKYASRVKSLNNYLKNYRGKLEGFEKANILSLKAQWEADLQNWITADAGRQAKYGTVIEDFNKAYDAQMAFQAQASRRPNLTFASTLMGQAATILEAVEERSKSDDKRGRRYKDSAWPAFKAGMKRTERGYDFETDRTLLKMEMKGWTGLPLDRLPESVKTAVEAGPEAIDALVDNLYDNTRLGDEAARLEMVDMDKKALLALGDPMIELAVQMDKIAAKAEKQDRKHRQEARKLADARTAAKRKVMAALLEMKEGQLAPDANSTIRFTYGNVKRYHPADAVTYMPFTTLKGVLEKETGSFPFHVPEKVKTLHADRDFGRYEDPAAKDVVTCFLNTTNVTGGNSGSPTFNAKGEQVGIIFDMTYESVIGDYHVIPEFQRTISVDIRYVLWVTEKFSGARHIIEEIGI